MEEDVKIKYEKEIRNLRYYIELNPGQPKFLVSAKTHIATEVIDELIEEGIFTEEGRILKLPTRQTMKSEERRELINRLKATVCDDQATIKKSQLIADLEKKRNGESIRDER